MLCSFKLKERCYCSFCCLKDGDICVVWVKDGGGEVHREREKRGQAFLKGNHSSTSVVCPKDGRSNNAACEGDFCLFFVCLRSLEQKKVDEQ